MKGGARAEFTEFAHSRWPSLVRLGFGLTGDRGFAEDLAQTTLVNAYASHGSARADDPDAYVRRMLLNAFRGGFRKRRVAEELSESPPDSPVADPAGAHDDRASPWAERLDVGPWGFCYRNTWDGAAGSDSCVPISVNQPGGNARSLGSADFNFRVAFSVIIGPRQLSYVVARTGPGAPFLVRPYRVGAANFVVLATASKLTTRWVAYSAVGARLGSGSFYN